MLNNVIQVVKEAELDVGPIFWPNPTHKWSDRHATQPDLKLTWNFGPDLARPILHDFQLSIGLLFTTMSTTCHHTAEKATKY